MASARPSGVPVIALTRLAPFVGLLPAMALCAILGGNDLSTCLGSSLGARALRYPQALALASVGLFAGILLEGNKLSSSIIDDIVFTSDPRFILSIEFSSLLLMSVLTYRKLPISLSQVAIGAAIGSAIAEGIGVNTSFVLLVALSWLLTPLSGLALALLLSIASRRITKKTRTLLSLNMLYAYLTIFSGVYAAYTLGANTVGLIIGLNESSGLLPLLTSFVFGVATLLGMLTLSQGTT